MLDLVRLKYLFQGQSVEFLLTATNDVMMLVMRCCGLGGRSYDGNKKTNNRLEGSGNGETFKVVSLYFSLYFFVVSLLMLLITLI